MSYAVETYSMCNETKQIISESKVFEYELPNNAEDSFVEKRLCLLEGFQYFQNKFSEIEKNPSISLSVSSLMKLDYYDDNRYEVATYHKTPNSEKRLKIHFDDDADFIMWNELFRKRTDKMWESSVEEDESTKEEIDLAQLSEIFYGKNGGDNEQC